MFNKLQKGEKYKSFEVIDVQEIKDFKSIAIHLRHIKTGLEVFHMLNDDEENLFSFSFRTPNTKANGAAHILEHSVLCGSEKFPLKDPFIKMSNQSVKTYLNAMTYPEHTTFPASSTVREDYFNLMSVYGDAVFFPLLQKEIFMQEAHHLELNDKGEPVIQGVVYNEMKGAYSSFDSIAMDSALHSVFRGTIYEKDSGGDPDCIPSITHQELKDFHHRWYRPDNCFVFLYGNIPTEEQLDFLQENFITRLEKKFPEIQYSEENKKAILDEFNGYVTSVPVEKPFTVYEEGPAGETKEKNNTVVVNWNLGRMKDNIRALELLILTGILINHDGSPLQKALIDCNLGEDLAPSTGIEGSLSETMFSAGLRGVKSGDEEKVYQIVRKCLEEVYEKGINKKDLDAILMNIEFSQREIKRAHGPYSLRIMNGPINAWLYGENPFSRIRTRKDVELVKEKIFSTPRYLENLLKEYLLDNNYRTINVITPSSDYSEKHLKIEKENARLLMEKTSAEKIKAELEELHKFQSMEEDYSCLPHLKPGDFLKDLEKNVEQIPTVCKKIKCKNIEADFFHNDLNTNGVVYFDVALPADVLKPEDYLLLPAFCEVITSIGYNGMTWDKAMENSALHINALSAGLIGQNVPDTEYAKESLKKFDYCGREWVFVRTSFLEEESENSLKILTQMFNSTDFSDYKRIGDILTEMRNDADSSVIPNGHDYAMIRTKKSLNRIAAIDEIWNGLTSVLALHDFTDQDIKKVAGEFERIFGELKKGGVIIHTTCEKEYADKIEQLLPEFVDQGGFGSLSRISSDNDDQFIKLAQKDFDEDGNTEVIVTGSAQVGFAAQCSPASLYGTAESAAEDICTHWLSNSLLWEKLRTIGGAYGAFCDNEMRAGVLVFATYRDPSCLQSCDIFADCIREAKENIFSQEELEKAITGTYSRWIQPRTPQTKGYVAFMRKLYGLSEQDKVQVVKNILNVTAVQLKAAFTRLYEGIISDSHRVVVGPKTLITKDGYSGKYTELPL